MIENNMIQISLLVIILLSIWILVQSNNCTDIMISRSKEHMSNDCNCIDNMDVDQYNDHTIYTPYHTCQTIDGLSENSNEIRKHVHSMFNDYDKLFCGSNDGMIIRKNDDYNNFPVDPYLNY
jgi:hypothetical protein